MLSDLQTDHLLSEPDPVFCFRLIAALSVMATLFVGVLIMTRIDSDAWQQWFLVSTLLMVVALNICTAIYQGGLIGWALLNLKRHVINAKFLTFVQVFAESSPRIIWEV